MATAARWTADMVRALPDDPRNRYEVVDGVLLVTPAPAGRHQWVISRFVIELGRYLGSLGLDELLFLSPADISWAHDVLVQPDIFVLAEPMKQGWAEAKSLLLAIEVLSPSTRGADRGRKRAAYQRYNVGTYWIVDPDARAVEIWHPRDETPEIVKSTLHWRVSPDAPALSINLPRLFERLPGLPDR